MVTTEDQAKSAGPSVAAMTKFSQCLSLERPESYSALGRANEAAIHVTKFPQPMIYSPAAGLVIYEPVGMDGVAHMEWLDKLSGPKVVRTRSPKAGRAPVQHLWRPPSPSGDTFQPQRQQEREMSLRYGRSQQNKQPSSPCRRTRSSQQPSSPAAAKQHMLHSEQHLGSNMLQEQLHAACPDRRPYSPGADSTAGRLWGSDSAGTAAAATTGWGLGNVTCLCTQAQKEGLSSLSKGFSTSGSPTVAGHCVYGTNSKHSRLGKVQHASKQTSSSRQAPQVISDRLTLTQPYVFRWGGRISSKHRAFGEMRSSCNPDGTGWKVSAGRPSVSMMSGNATGTTPQQQQQQHHEQKPSSVDPQVTAAAAGLGARAERLMKLLELRVPRQHSRMPKQRPMSGRMQQLQHPDADSSYSDELVYGLEDEPISMQEEYLRL